METQKNTRYLYGAAVQGIQSFIFQTNELKDIIGASELVNKICMDGKDKENTSNESGLFDSFAINGNSILRAAGNIKFLFNNKEDCAKAVREFPKVVMQEAPGITISQAVVKLEYTDDQFKALCKDQSLDGDISKKKASNKTLDPVYVVGSELLEQKLRAQRNKPFNSITTGPIACMRSRKTGLPAVATESVKNSDTLDYLDAATKAKRANIKHIELAKKAFCEKDDAQKLSYDDIVLNIDEMTDTNSWIAIVHADGNGLGEVVQQVGSNPEKFKEFSAKLDLSTQQAAVEAFDVIKKDYLNEEEASKQDKYKIPLRPIVLGGDDLTMIMRGSIAIPYVKAFMEAFEARTYANLSGLFNEAGLDFDKLTACAGIAYIKASYPFYYGYNLAEDLCSQAKKDAKKPERRRSTSHGLAPSCLMFHKVQDSFVASYEDIIKRELSPQQGLSLKFGPYYVFEDDTRYRESKDAVRCIKNRWTIDEMIDTAGKLKTKEGNALKSNLRQWLGLLGNNAGLAHQKLDRIKQIVKLRNDSTMNNLLDRLSDRDLYVRTENKGTEKESTFKTLPVYDVLSNYGIMNQVTLNKENKK